MLGKLFKYEIKSTARIFLPMFLIILALSGINKLAILFLPDAFPFNILKAILTFLYFLVHFARAQAELQYPFHWNLYVFIAGIAVFLLIIFLACLMQIYCAISIGQLSNNHKLLTSVGVYIGLYSAGQILMTALLAIIALFNASSIEQLSQINQMTSSFSQGIGNIVLAILVSQALLNLTLGVVYFFLSRYMLGKKLNLA